MKVKFKKLHPDVELPKYATEGSAGFDITAHSFKLWYDPKSPVLEIGQLLDVSKEETRVFQLTPGARILIGAGFAVAIPEGYELQVRSRSGLALKTGLVVLNSPGTIDSDYRGEVGAIICNTSKHTITISLGERIAQCVLAKHEVASFEEVKDLTETARGEGGFGSTGGSISHHNV